MGDYMCLQITLLKCPNTIASNLTPSKDHKHTRIKSGPVTSPQWPLPLCDSQYPSSVRSGVQVQNQINVYGGTYQHQQQQQQQQRFLESMQTRASPYLQQFAPRMVPPQHPQDANAAR
ncbi:hypothetical protein ACEQ8H_007483 [Pleosporales sp. CAS-2024a]